VRKIRLTSHAIDRWRERVGLAWSIGKICDYLYRRFVPHLHRGIEPYIIDGQLYYVFLAGKLNEKTVLAVLTPESEGLWSGWTVVTFLTDEVLGNVEGYFEWLYERAERINP